MNKFEVIVLPVAENDIQTITDYITETLCNRAAALKLVNKIYEQICRISDFPLSGNILNLKIPLEFEYRYIVVENYLVFYTTDETQNIVTIERVLYGSSDYSKILNNI